MLIESVIQRTAMVGTGRWELTASWPGLFRVPSNQPRSTNSMIEPGPIDSRCDF